MKRDANDVENLTDETNLLLKIAEENALQNSGWSTGYQMVKKYPSLRPPVINGLIREGEIINIIASAKAGKSLLTYNMAFSVITGKPFIRSDWTTTAGDVAIIDNELHPETIACRLTNVHKHMKLMPYAMDKIHIQHLRGQQKNINDVKELLIFLKNKNIKLLILDSLYKFFPDKFNENDNADMTKLYNLIDSMIYNYIPEAAVVIIHHTSKGNQSNKSIQDVGSGAGASNRAADAHMIIREHEEKNYFIVDAVVRNFKQPDPFVMKFEYPCYTNAPEMSAENLKGKVVVNNKKQKTEIFEITDGEFLSLLNNTWQNKNQLSLNLKEIYSDITQKNAELLIENIIAKYNLHELKSVDGEKLINNSFLVCSFRGALKFKMKGIV